ncbi:hypothetical protein NUM3379_06240 [Kineococcus sp. NUM-3379]
MPEPVPARPETRPVSRPVVAGVAAVSATALAAAVLASLSLTGTSPGALLAELRGQVRTDSYGSADRAPRGDVPAWLPPSSAEVVVRRPGEEQGAGPGAVAVQADVPHGWALPQECAAVGYSQPWDGGGNWPLARSTPLSSCPDDGGAWTAFLDGGRLYAWR